MIRHYAQLFLLFFGVSTAFYPLMETGHEILHHFKNSFHHHEMAASDHHHTIADHHVGEDHEHQVAEEEREGFNYLALMLGSSFPSSAVTISQFNVDPKHYTMFVSFYKSISQLPSTPPPLGRNTL